MTAWPWIRPCTAQEFTIASFFEARPRGDAGANGSETKDADPFIRSAGRPRSAPCPRTAVGFGGDRRPAVGRRRRGGDLGGAAGERRGVAVRIVLCGAR